ESARNATLMLPSGQPVYQVSTPTRVFHTEQTTIAKFLPDGSSIAIGLVELHSFHTDICQITGRNVLPKSDGIFRSGISFTSSNGKQYTWKRKTSTALLTDKSGSTVATWERSHSGILSRNPRPAQLSVLSEGVQIIDEIVVTFMYIEQREQQLRRARGNAARGAGIASIAGAG
ncbi:hypothetical protein V5O48_010937, partial [Marasmius crinis-equi]